MNVAPNREFSRSSNLLVSLEFTSDRPRLPWQRKFGNFDGKLAKTRLIQEIEPQMLQQTGGFRGQAICRCHWNLRQTDEHYALAYTFISGYYDRLNV